jgi:hypothetical protein
MRAHHTIAIAAVILIGFGVKLFVLPTLAAEADMRTLSINALQMHFDYPNMKGLPVQKLHDMTFVFSDGD